MNSKPFAVVDRVRGLVSKIKFIREYLYNYDSITNIKDPKSFEAEALKNIILRRELKKIEEELHAIQVSNGISSGEIEREIKVIKAAIGIRRAEKGAFTPGPAGTKSKSGRSLSVFLAKAPGKGESNSEDIPG